MKDFFKMMFASMLGFVLISIITIFLFMAFIMAMLSFAQTEEVIVNDNTILRMKLNYEITDRSVISSMPSLLDVSSFKPKPGLREILKSIENAKSDSRIKGIYLDLTDVPSGLATISEIRNALIDFKESEKFIYAYGNLYIQKAYYLATVADKVFLNPEGFVDFRGFNGNVMFIKGLLDKLDIEAQVIRHGKFKSAIEPLLYDKMSDENKEQTIAYIQSIWDNSLIDISQTRGLSISRLNEIADGLLAQSSDRAFENNIIDSLLYYDEFLALLAQELEVEEVLKDNLISLSKYGNAKSLNQDTKRSKNKIAVIFAEGDIGQGEGSETSIGSEGLARTIRSARLDESIKAVVLRVNSPGGDGLASDVILREVSLTQQEKPVVVSMGNYAASGGYYIACAADKIIANPSTLTGSIGVFGVIPNFKGFLNNKMGITFDGVKTNNNAEFISVTEPMTDYQKAVLKNEIERFYTTFIGHVSKGRGMTLEGVDEIAQGRVWTGSDALEIGLVDELGGLNKAIDVAADIAGLEDFRTVDLPKQKEPIEQLIEELFGEMETRILRNELGEHYKYLEYINSVKEYSGVQARLPFEIEIK